jgi:EAL domain-containing protein (putative c-di-GMP-specific phosphodiesterase class I)
MIKNKITMFNNFSANYPTLDSLANWSALKESLKFAADRDADVRDDSQLIICAVGFNHDLFLNLVFELGWETTEDLVLQFVERIQIFSQMKIYRVHETLFAFLVIKERNSSSEINWSALRERLMPPFNSRGICREIPASTASAIINFDEDFSTITRIILSSIKIASDNGSVHHYYSIDDVISQNRSFTIKNELMRALSSNAGFSMHFQPKVSALTRKCIGVEALLRWKHTALGEISPSEFLVIAEQSGKMHEITKLVIEMCFRQLTIWRSNNLNIKLAINISASDFDYPGLADHFKERIEYFKIPFDDIQIEFTETALARNPEQCKEQLLKLSSLGVELAIDDFGTGYAGPGYIRHIPAKVIKIDQSFIRLAFTNIRERTIVSKIIELTHSLEARVVAEGVEDYETATLLTELGADELQGYLFGRPMAAEIFEKWYTKNLNENVCDGVYDPRELSLTSTPA